MPDGWWYTARLPDASRVVALHVDAEHAAAILHRPGAWDEELARTLHVAKALEGASLVTEPKGAEACGARLEPFAGEGWLAAGDAAISFDPLSSQGILNALYTGTRAGQAIHAALDGEATGLTAYAARLEVIRDAYLRHHRIYYQMESRWLERPFWMRRQ